MTDVTQTDPPIPHPAAALIKQWLANDEFASRVHVWEDTLRNPQRGESWYTRRRTDEPVAAEADLIEDLAERELVAAGIMAVAQGMHAIAQANPQDRRRTPYVFLTRLADDRGFPYPFGASTNARTVFIVNPEVPGCGCVQPAGSHLFGTYGLLGLKAVTLTVDPGRPSQNQLCLVLPHRDQSKGPAAVAIAQFDLQGHVRAHTLEPLMNHWGPLMYSLGLRDKSEAWEMWQTSGGTDDRLGPGCTALLSSSLTDLGAYLTDAADKLSGNHTH